MQTVRHGTRTNGVTDYRPDVKAITRPVVTQFFDGKVRMYRGENGKKFIADAFDRFFNPVESKKIKPQGYKGEGIGTAKMI